MPRIVGEDAEGRVIDLHTMRTTLKHYTVLGLSDTAAVIELLPGITTAEAVAAKATGTDALPLAGNPQQLGRETVRNDAVRCAGERQSELAQNAPENDHKHGWLRD